MGRRPDPRRISSMYGGGPSAAHPPRAPDKATYAVRSLSFGSFPAETTFAAEYTRQGRAADQMWVERRVKDGRRLLVVRMWDQAGPTVLDPESASSVRVVVELDTIDRASTNSDGVSLFLRLSRPPTFEAIAVRPPYERPPWPRQVASIDVEHARIAGCASSSLRLQLRTAVELRAFLLEAAAAGAPPVVRAIIFVDPTRRFSDATLGVLQSWLLALDFRVAFQLEKVVRNGLVDAVKAVGLRGKVDSLVAEKGAPAAERILALFADRLEALKPWTTSSSEEVGSARKEAPVVASAHAARRSAEAVLLGPVDRLQVKRRKTEPAVIILDSSDSSGPSEDDSDDDLANGLCFFVSPHTHDGHVVTPLSIHRSIGDFAGTETALIPAKYMARIAQAFSSSKPTLELSPDQILFLPDIESPSGSCFSDGVGLISSALAVDVVKALKLKLGARQRAPTCFQFRMGGAKGMLQVDPSLEGKVIALRPSQIKFKSPSTHLAIVGTFGAGQAFLNRPLVTLLEALGIAQQRFLDLQLKATRSIRKARLSLVGAVALLEDWSLAPSTSLSSTLAFLAELSPTASTATFSNPFVASCLDAAVVHALRDIKYSARIPLPGCYNLVGVLDVEDFLAPDQVYVRLAHKDGSTEYLNGTVAISRSPTNHPGDLRLVEAVGKLPRGVGDRIRGLTNCVVFSCHGERSLPSKLAGGDLDGDVYLLLTPQSGLLPAPWRIMAAAAYDPSPTVKLDHEATIEDGTDFFFDFVTRDRTGLVATRQLHLADALTEGLVHRDCLKLAQLHSDCVDSAKSGSFVPYDSIPRKPARGMPDFLANDAPDSYRSSRALGQLYRAIGEEALSTAALAGSADRPLADVDPHRLLTSALSSTSFPYLVNSRLPSPSRPLVAFFRSYLPSFASELLKLLPRPSTTATDEEALFLSVSLSTTKAKVDTDEKLRLGRRREQAGELFALVRRLVREGDGGATGAASAGGAAGAIARAWSAWHAAVEEGEDRAKAAADARRKRRAGDAEGASAAGSDLGLRTWGWLALGVLVEELRVAERESVEVVVVE
ncbi:hypothetical protein JCM8208_007102 [Rhodotorula glutinis]